MSESESKSGGNLEKVLRAGHFALTGELGPPRGGDPEAVREKAGHLAGNVDAVNITDNQTAVVRMASWAASLIAKEAGVEAVYQMVCRDRNRLAMQADILGASSLGIHNILCLSGDHMVFGDHPGARGVFDVDSTQLIGIVKKMRDESLFQGGAEINTPPRMFIGAAANPFAEPHKWRIHRLAKKVSAGADFIQTQCVYDMDRFDEWMKQAVDMGLTEKAYILAGITPLKNVGMARYMQSKVPGMVVPDSLVKRLMGVPWKQAAEEGIRIAIEQVDQLRETRGVAGIHLMAIGWEHRVAEIAERAGLLPRPVL
ncbi:MAG: methylenetetrahydrofolate reductase [Desulfatibacillaceae bacterium]